MQGYSFDRPLVISIDSSRWLKLTIILSHLLVLLFVLIFLNIDLMFGLVLATMITLSFVYYYRLHIQKNLNKSVLLATHSFQKGKQAGWSIRLPTQKDDLSVELLPSSFIHTAMVILNFKDHDSHQYSLIIPKGAVTKQIHRQLRARLKVMS